TKIITGNITQEEYAPIAESCSALSSRPLTINRKPSATVEDISFLAHQVNNLGFIVIDYLGLIRNNYGTKLYEKVTDTSNKLKALARQLGVPILCLAQLNREVEGRQSGRPKISDLRDSGAIEQDADGILLLYRDMDDVPDDYPADLTCIIGKNRHGRTGEINLKFFLPTGRIYAVMED
ncbi:MAG: DnaB-like helicase C-terminal domain-containing protein, partial [Syntrophomonadaceae bacterium]